MICNDKHLKRGLVDMEAVWKPLHDVEDSGVDEAQMFALWQPDTV
jgi:hypothetical protein